MRKKYSITLRVSQYLTESGYRLYNDEALQKLQQILFFKELGFKLKEIKEILQKPFIIFDFLNKHIKIFNTSPVLDNIIGAIISKIF